MGFSDKQATIGWKAYVFFHFITLRQYCKYAPSTEPEGMQIVLQNHPFGIF